MKNLTGKEAKIYHYIDTVLMAVRNYYGYEFIKVEDDQEILKREDGKYCYFLRGDVFHFLTLGVNSVYQDAEMISMLYRILEELRIEEVVVELNASAHYPLKKLQEYLEYLDVDYELGSKQETKELSYEIKALIGNKEILLLTGEKNKNQLKGTLNLDPIIEMLTVIFEDREFDIITQVYLVGEKEEERIAVMKLAQDLRWCEIVVDTDQQNLTKEEQLKLAEEKNSNFIVMMEQENLNKGLVKVIDSYTKEETLVDEAEIIDYIVSNI